MEENCSGALSSPPQSTGAYPVDEHVFWQSSLGVLDAAEAIHHPLVLKVAGELLQAPIWGNQEGCQAQSPEPLPHKGPGIQSKDSSCGLCRHPQRSTSPRVLAGVKEVAGRCEFCLLIPQDLGELGICSSHIKSHVVLAPTEVN